MNLDFTIKTYKLLIETLRNQGFSFITFNEYLKDQSLEKIIILRHDVDKHPDRSLAFAKIQNDLGIKGTYYFRITPDSFDEMIIKEISSLGHEIGYHYEDIVLESTQLKKKYRYSRLKPVDYEKILVDAALKRFTENLMKLRNIVPIKTICMHGSPLSKWDNRIIWDYFNYKNFGINGEPYFDLNYNEVLYITDTGRKWNGERANIRDRMPINSDSLLNANTFHSTFDIIKAAINHELPNRIMMTFHPQRWNEKLKLWIEELLSQTIKNVIKSFI